MKLIQKVPQYIPGIQNVFWQKKPVFCQLSYDSLKENRIFIVYIGPFYSVFHTEPDPAKEFSLLFAPSTSRPSTSHAMRKFACIILMFACCLPTYGQFSKMNAGSLLRILFQDTEYEILGEMAETIFTGMKDPYLALQMADNNIEKAFSLNKIEQARGMYLFKALMYRTIGEADLSLHSISQAESLMDANSPKEDWAEIELEKGDTYKILEDYAITRHHYEQALKLYQGIRKKKKVAECYLKISEIYIATNDLKDAIYFGEMALELAEKAATKSALMLYYSNLAWIYAHKGDIPKAEEILNAYTTSKRSKNNRYVRLLLFAHKANLKLMNGEPDSAKYFLLRAKSALEIMAPGKGYSSIDGDLGNVALHQGRYEEATYFLQKNLESALREKSVYGKMNAYSDLADKYYYEKNMEEAVRYYFLAYEFAENLGAKLKMAELTHRIGICSYSDNPDKALEYLLSAENTYNELGMQRILVVIWQNIANAYKDKGEYDKALSLLNKALDLGTKLQQTYQLEHVHFRIGLVYEKMEDYSNALLYFKKSLEYLGNQDKKAGLPFVYLAIGGVLLKLKKAEESKKYLDLGLTHFKQDKLNAGLANAYLHHGVWYFRQNEFKQSLSHLQTSIDLYEQSLMDRPGYMSKNLLLQNGHYAYEYGIEAATLAKDTVQAFSFIEKAKARKFLELMELSGKKGIKLPDKFQARQDDIERQSKYVDSKLAEEGTAQQREYFIKQKEQLMLKREALSAQIKQEVPEYAAIKYPQPSTVFDLQRSLKQDELFLNYYIGEDHAYAFVANKNFYRIVKLDSGKVITEAVSDFKKNFVERSRRAYQGTNASLKSGINQRFFQASSRLYHLLWEPLEAFIPQGQEKIIIAPSNSLAYLPFDCLVSDHVVKEFHQYQYLTKKYAISYYNSASSLVFDRNHSSFQYDFPKSFLAFANPEIPKKDYSSDQVGIRSLMRSSSSAWQADFSDLPHAEQEALSIADLFGREHADLFIGKQALESQLKKLQLENYQYIHFATHGRINSDHPNLSAIVLGKDAEVIDSNDAENGFLEAYEIFNLKLKAELVVLSACETGLGKLRKGEGMVGLPRSLMFAGAQSVITSLWSVADESTSVLFIDFYETLLQAPQNKQESLRKAQLNMIRNAGEYANPFHWAAFVFWGRD